MCGIAGIISKDDSTVSEEIIKMLGRMRHRGPDGCGLMANNVIRKGYTIDELDTKGLKCNVAMGHVRLAIVGGIHGLQPMTDCQKKLVVLHNGEIYNYKDLRRSLGLDHNFTTDTDSETIVHLIEEHYNGNLLQSVAESLHRLDGVYALAVSDGKEIVVARDMMGVKQLYIGENDKYVAFASERKPLWEIGITNEKRLLPSYIARLSKKGITTKRVLEPPIYPKNKISDFENAISSYREALIDAVRKRVQDLDRVGIIFSGGIDSVLIAKIASKFTDTICYTAGLIDSKDVKYAKLAAEKIGLKIKVNELTIEDIEDYIPKVIETIEDRSFNQIEVAIPIYASVEMAHDDGLKVMLTGQGADELFGGYPWYRVIVKKEGYHIFERYMKEDLLNLYRETLEREDKITMAHSIELRVPYLDPHLIKIAMMIDSKLKILSAEDKLGKYIHRELAKRMGIPAELADRPKEAAQHGSGIHKAILEIAEKNGFNEDIAHKFDYNSEKSIREKLGSSVRYGYKYGGKELWTTPDYVQLYLDLIALKNNLLNENELEYLKSILSDRCGSNLEAAFL